LTSKLGRNEFCAQGNRDSYDLLGESPMTNFNEVMTVQQMIDLVAFLQSGYQPAIPQYPTAS
ncbi:MAG: hypothetical protein V3U53_01115, partial [bacterium]